MNEVEELALDSVASGGPEEVLTEQANNNPDVPEVDPVETTALPEETPQDPVINEIIQPEVETSLINKNEPIPFAPFEDSPFAYDFHNNEEYMMASSLGFRSVKDLIEALKDNGQELPLVGGWFKERQKLLEKKKKFEENTNKILDDKTLTSQEQADLIKKELKEQGITYGDEANTILLVEGDGSKIVNDITKQVYDDPRVNNGILGGNRVYGAKGDRKFPDDLDIEKYISYVANVYEAGIKAQSGGVDVLTTKAMRQLGDLTLLTDSSLERNLLSLRSGQLPDLPTIFAMRDIFNIETLKLDKMINDLDTNAGAEDFLNVREQLELVANLQAKISGVKTDIGRALRSFQEPSRYGPDGQLIQVTGRPMEKIDPETGDVIEEGFKFKKSEQTDVVEEPLDSQLDLRNMIDRMGGEENLNRFFQAYKTMPHKHGKLKLIKDFHKYGNNADRVDGVNQLGMFLDNISEYWINSLLSGTVTHTRNMLGNFLMLTKEVAEDYVIGAVNTTLRREGIQFSDVHASAGAMVMTFLEAGMNGVQTYKTGIKPSQISDTSKIDVNRKGNRISGASWEANENTPLLGLMIDGAGKVINFPTDMLDVEDTFFKVMAQRYLISMKARKSARAKGLTGDEALDYVTEFIVDPPESALKESRKGADYLVFQQEIEGIAKGLGRARDIPGFRYLIPFFKTPYNISRVAFKDGTPLGLVTKEQRDIFLNGTREEKQKQYARWGTSAGLLFYGMYMASQEVIIEDDDGAKIELPKATSNLRPDQFGDKNIRGYNEILTDRGVTSYSLYRGNDENGNPKYRSVRGLEPFSSIFGLGVDLHNIWADPDLYGSDYEAEAMEVTMGVISALANSVSNKSFTQTIDSTFDVLQGDINLENFGTKMATSFVPAIIRQIGDLQDPVSRQALTLLDEFARRVPYVRKSSPPKYDLEGNIRPRYVSAVSPIPIQKVDKKSFSKLFKNEWSVFGRAPEVMTNKIRTNFGIGELEIKDKFLLDEVHKNFIKEYKTYMELLLSGNFLYQQNKQRWIESNYTDIEARDFAMAEVNNIVSDMRARVIDMMYWMPMNYEHGLKLKKLIDEKQTRKRDKKNRRMGIN